MSSCVQRFRDLAWSDLCLTDLEAYKCFLEALNHGIRAISSSRVDGSLCIFGSECSCVDANFGFESSSVLRKDTRCDSLVDSSSVGGDALGSEGDVNSGSDSPRLAVRHSGVSTHSTCGRQCVVAGGGSDAVVELSGEKHDSKVDGKSVADGRLVQVAVGVNTAANRKSRERKRAKKREAMEVQHGSVWQCDEDLRKELCNSRAKVFIQRNKSELRKHELGERLYDSNYGIASKVAAMSRRLGVKDGTSAWASRVMVKAVESIASSSGCDEPYRSDSSERDLHSNWRVRTSTQEKAVKSVKPCKDFLDLDDTVPCVGLFNHAYDSDSDCGPELY